jgi:hypothetical protein
MAVICNNIIHVSFNVDNDDTTGPEAKKKFVDDFASIFEMYDLDRAYEYAEENEALEIDFSSKWSAPIDILQEFCDKYNLTIIGVAYEFANGYVESFELNFNPDSV